MRDKPIKIKFDLSIKQAYLNKKTISCKIYFDPIYLLI